MNVKYKIHSGMTYQSKEILFPILLIVKNIEINLGCVYALI